MYVVSDYVASRVKPKTKKSKRRDMNMKFKKMMIAAMAAMMMTGCGGGKTDEVVYDATYDTKNYKDYISSGTDFESLNYLTSYLAVDGRLVQNFVDKLVAVDKYGQIVPNVAETIDHNEDYSVWTFKIREGVKWFKQDGSVYGEVTADDFVYSVEYILNPENVSGNIEMTTLIKGAKDYYKKMCAGEPADFSTVGVKAIDKYTVEYTMEGGGKPYFSSVLTYGSYAPANREFIESIPDADGIPGTKRFGSTTDLFLYCGPYIMTEYIRDNSKTLTKNKEYWNAENVPFDTVTIIAIKDAEQALEYFERGELSYATLSATQVESQMRKNNKYLVQLPLASSVYGMLLNNAGTYEGSEDTNKAISNENFRKALFYGIDSDQYNEVGTAGDATTVRGYGFTAQNFMFTEDGKDYTSLGELAKWQTYHFDADKALEYKEKAMQELKAEGVTFPVKFLNSIKAGNETEGNKAQVFESILEETLGKDFIDVETVEYPTSWFTDVRDKGNYTVYLKGWGPDYKDPINILNTMTTTSGQINDGVNLSAAVTHFSDPVFDKMVEDANAITTDVTARYTAFANAEAYLLEHAYFVPMFTGGGSYQVTTINRYSKPFSNGDSTHYVGWDAKDHAITTEEMEQYKAEWEADRKALGLG